MLLQYIWWLDPLSHWSLIQPHGAQCQRWIQQQQKRKKRNGNRCDVKPRGGKALQSGCSWSRAPKEPTRRQNTTTEYIFISGRSHAPLNIISVELHVKPNQRAPHVSSPFSTCGVSHYQQLQTHLPARCNPIQDSLRWCETIMWSSPMETAANYCRNARHPPLSTPQA